MRGLRSDHVSDFRVNSVQVSRGGVPKLPILGAHVDELGLAGDRQRDARHHGGPDRAVSLWSLEVIQALRDEGHDLYPGAAGENVTLRGVPWAEVRPGAVLSLGDVLRLEVVSFAAPCKAIGACFSGNDFTRISEKLYPGTSRVYARVLVPGFVAPGQRVLLDVDRCAPVGHG